MDHKKDFKNANIDSVLPDQSFGGFNVCDIVSFTNDYGVVFDNLEVLGFQEPDEYGRCVFLNCSCYWFPKKLEEINLSK